MKISRSVGSGWQTTRKKKNIKKQDEIQEMDEGSLQLQSGIGSQPFDKSQDIDRWLQAMVPRWGPPRVMKWFIFTHQTVLIQGLVNVPIKHHPTIGDIISNRYLKVMSKIPKKGHLPTPVICNVNPAVRLQSNYPTYLAQCHKSTHLLDTNYRPIKTLIEYFTYELRAQVRYVVETWDELSLYLVSGSHHFCSLVGALSPWINPTGTRLTRAWPRPASRRPWPGSSPRRQGRDVMAAGGHQLGDWMWENCNCDWGDLGLLWSS